MTQEQSKSQTIDTGEEEQKKIVDAKAAIHEAQKENADNDDTKGLSADRATGVNASHEEPIDPRMTRMPPG